MCETLHTPDAPFFRGNAAALRALSRDAKGVHFMSDPRYRDDPTRPTDPAYRDTYVAPVRRGYGGWGIGAVIVAIIIIAAIAYGYNGTRTNVASNTTQPTTGMNAPAPMAPTTPATPKAPATPAQKQ
jgi:hypothetical protein